MKRILHKAQKNTHAVIPAAATQRGTDREIFAISARGLAEQDLYDTLRAKVPMIDACIGKIIRLAGGFSVVCENERIQPQIDRFCRDVPVNLTQCSLQSFADAYLDSLLTYGKAVGEILIARSTHTVGGLYNADPALVKAKPSAGFSAAEYYIISDASELKIPRPERILYTTLNPSQRHPDGVSILRGLPCFSDILLRIYECIGQNFDRVGNVRYAVTYKPPQDAADQNLVRERALLLADEWAKGMEASRNGVVKDFVAVGDVEIKVIGAENQLIETEIPVRQILEQLIAKLSIPPFLLGLNWSSTERMSAQQADILTSELEFYRRLLTPVLHRIVETHLRLLGEDAAFDIVWNNINLQDEAELAKARLNNAQAEAIELENEKTKAERSMV